METVLVDCCFENSTFNDMNFWGTQFENCLMTGSLFSQCTLSNVTLLQCDLSDSTFRKSGVFLTGPMRTLFVRAKFEDCDLSSTRFRGAILTDLQYTQNRLADDTVNGAIDCPAGFQTANDPMIKYSTYVEWKEDYRVELKEPKKKSPRTSK